jgi:hypothetical protein
LPALTATAMFGIARKIVARYWHGQYAQYAQADPPGLRTVARFSADDPRAVMQAIARGLARDIDDIAVTRDALRAGDVDIVRLRAGTCVELTRAWTGVYLGEQTRYLLLRIDAALRSACRDVAWFARQDRDLREPFATPYDA